MKQLDPRKVAERLTARGVDPSAVAACADGAGDPAEEARLRADPEAVLLLRMLEQDARRRTRFFVLVGAAAAAVLVAVLLWVHGSSESVREPSLDAQLAAVGADLRDAAPDLFEGFEPRTLDPAENVSTARGGGRWIAPRGYLLDAPRQLRWTNPAGATRVEVRIRGAGVSWSESVEGEQVAAPALGPGRYVVSVRALDALGGQSLKRTFMVAAPDERARFEQALDQLRARSPARLADLVEAHYALHKRCFAVAEAAAERAAAQPGEVGEQGARILERLRRAP